MILLRFQLRSILLFFLLPVALLASPKNLQYDTVTHGVEKPPASSGSIYDYDFTGLSIGGLATGGGGGGGTPGGADRQLQFNNAFTFGGVPYATYDGTTVTFRSGARFTLSDPTDATKRVQFALANPSGTLKTLTITDNSVTVVASTAPATQFATGVGTGGIITYAQPLFSDIGGLLPLSQTTQNTNKLLGRYSAGVGNTQEITIGTNLTLSGAGVLDATGGGGGGTPGGSTTQFQYNNAGAFGGTNSLLFSGGFVQARSTTFRVFDNSDPTTSFNFSTANLPAGVNTTATLPNSSTPVIVGGLAAPVANQWVQYISTLGQQVTAQINFTNIAGSIGLAQNNFPIAHERFVDPVNGSDITGAANLAKPYLTVAAACAAASSGDVIYLYPNSTGYDQGTTALVIPAGVTIVGAGPDTTLIKGAVTGLTRAVVEPSTASAIYNTTIQNTSSTGIAFGVGSSSNAFTSAYVGGCKIIANAQGVYINKAATTGLVMENTTVSTQNDCLFQNISTATSEMRNCDFVADGTTNVVESKGLNVMNGTVRFNYGSLTVGNSVGTNVGAFGSGASAVIELHGVRISNSLGGATNYDVQSQSSATVGVDSVYRPDAGPLVSNGTITQLSRYALRDNNLTDFPNIGSGTRGDIIFRGATGWTKLAAGVDGNVLTTHGNTADPSWLTGGGGGGAVSDTAFSSAWNGQTTTGPSQNAVYDALHLFDTDDNGKINVLDQGAGITRTDAGGVILAALAAPSGAIVGTTDTQTLTNKRITKRVLTTAAPGPTPSVNSDNYDVVHFTGVSAAVTSMTTNLTGTPVQGDVLRMDFTDDGTARAITWGASFEASPGQALPGTTVAGERLDLGFVWNTVTSKWRILASSLAQGGGAGTGTVTSVGVGGANGITVSGSPITASGTISLGLPITLAGTAGKTLTVSNSLTLAGTDGSTLNIGTGGTLGSNAFNSTAFLTSSAISDAVFATAWNGDTTTAASRNAVYDEIHAFDTDDNGKVNVLDLTTAELVKTNTSGVVSSAVGGTDYANLAFKTVSVSGQSDVVADTAGDTLTLAAGANVTLTTTPGTDTVTIASTGGGGGSVSLTGTSPVVLTPSPTTGTGVVSLNLGTNFNWTAAQTITTNDTNSSTATADLTLVHNTTGTAGNGIGTSINLFAETDSGASQSMGNLTMAWQDAANATRAAYFDVFLVNAAGSSSSKMRVFPSGGLSVNNSTDPGAGIVSANSGYKIASTEFPIASNGIVKRTAANTYAASTSTDIVGLFTSCSGTQYLGADGACHSATAPGGSNTQVQFNNSGAFGGDAGFTFAASSTAYSQFTLTGSGGTAWTIAGAGSAGNPSYYTPSSLNFYNATNDSTPLVLLGHNIIADNSSNIGWQAAARSSGAALDTALYRNAAGVVEINNGTPGSYRDLICRNITISGGNFTGRINPRASGGCDETSSSTSTPNSDACDQWDITALAAADTFVAPSGTPVNGQKLTIRIKDNGTAQTLSFPTGSSGQYKFSTDLPAPTTTILGKTFYIGFIYNTASSRWENVAQLNNF